MGNLMTVIDLINLIVAILALVISLIPIGVNLYRFFKNRLTEKTLQVEISNLTNNNGFTTDWLSCDLTITNHTKKEFTITRIIVTIDNSYCKVWQTTKKSTNLKFPPVVVPVMPIRLSSHDATILDLYIETPYRLNKETPAVLSLITPYQKLNYPLNLTMYSSNDNGYNK